MLYHLRWFQTSLLLTALPLRRVIIFLWYTHNTAQVYTAQACCFRVAALFGYAALALSPSGIAPELNRIQLSVICRDGQSGKVIDQLARPCLPLGHPSAASGACAVVQIIKAAMWQASLKAALYSFTAAHKARRNVLLLCFIYRTSI